LWLNDVPVEIVHNYASELRRCGDLKLSRALFAPGAEF
jgi:hypothetical protein